MAGQTDREALEEYALKVCSAEIYFDFANEIENMSDQDIQNIINCAGDYEKEIALAESQK